MTTHMRPNSLVQPTNARPPASRAHGPGGRLRFTFLASALTLWAGTTEAQATHLTLPKRETLLWFTREWGRESALGDLVTRPMAGSDVEVRFWTGYGLAGTSGTVLQRSGGVWRAWHAVIHSCRLLVPMAIGDTLSTPMFAAYRQQARARCGDRTSNLSSGLMITADTVALEPLVTADYESFWQELKREGILELPPEVPRSWFMLDGTTYVVEVRRGNDYRASVIEHTTPESRADRLVQRLATILERGPREEVE
jgi:hypothetical protein